MPSAQFLVGYSSMLGWGCECNEPKGMAWLHKAAAADQADAQVLLANYILRGEPGPEETGKALTWLERAAKQESREAKFYLAALLAAGVDPSRRDPERALAILRDVMRDIDDDPTAFEIRAAAYAMTGKFADAQKDQRKALKMAQASGGKRRRSRRASRTTTAPSPGRGICSHSERANRRRSAPHGRVEVMDVLRGVALFGVFLMNFTGFASASIMATEQQLLLVADRRVRSRVVRRVALAVPRQGQHAVRIPLRPRFLSADATTRSSRASISRQLYRRRLFVLLIIGCHPFLLLLDLGHPPSLCDRGLPAAAAATIELARAGRRRCVAGGFRTHAAEVAGGVRQRGKLERDFRAVTADSDVLARQQLSERGDYLGIVAISSIGYSSTTSRAE